MKPPKKPSRLKKQELMFQPKRKAKFKTLEQMTPEEQIEFTKAVERLMEKLIPEGNLE